MLSKQSLEAKLEKETMSKSEAYPTLLVPRGPEEPVLQLPLGEYVLKLELGELTAFGQEVAARELRESPERKEAAIKDLRDLLKLEEHNGLTVPLDNDYWLLRFLRICKFYPNSAFELIKKYYRFRIKYPQLYESLVPSKERAILDPNILVFSPNRDQLGRRLFICRGGKNWNYKKVSSMDIARSSIICGETVMLEQETQVHGVVIIFDLDGFSLGNLLQFTPSFARMSCIWFQECCGMRAKGLHFINNNRIFSIVFNIFKPFFSKKFLQRTHFHGRDMASLHAHISPECLPKEYGGILDIPNIPEEVRCDFLEQLDKEFKANVEYGFKNHE